MWRDFSVGRVVFVHPVEWKVPMLRSLARTSMAACALGWATPAAALECADFAALLDADVPQSVIQNIVLESPPEDGWACLAASGHAVTELEMAAAFRRQDPTRELSWQARFKQCAAGQGLRRRTRRLLADEESSAAERVEPETIACRRAASLQEALGPDPGA